MNWVSMIEISFVPRRAAVLPATLAFGTLLGIAAGGAVAAPVGESPWVGQTDSKVRLVSGTITQNGSTALYVAVQLRMNPGWKTYWRNPGESGVPPSFDWSASKNLKSAEVLYPAPHRFADAGGAAIGYKGEVIFPVKITPEQAGEPVDLALTFAYGLCKNLCIPNSASLKVVLPPDLGKGDDALIETALDRVPKPEKADALPRIASVTENLEGPKPGLEIEALFPEGASGADLFVDNPEIAVPVPKALGPLEGGKQRFAVTFYSPSEAAAIKGKPLRMVLVTDEGATETTWTAK